MEKIARLVSTRIDTEDQTAQTFVLIPPLKYVYDSQEFYACVVEVLDIRREIRIFDDTPDEKKRGWSFGSMDWEGSIEELLESFGYRIEENVSAMDTETLTYEERKDMIDDILCECSTFFYDSNGRVEVTKNGDTHTEGFISAITYDAALKGCLTWLRWYK